MRRPNCTKFGEDIEPPAAFFITVGCWSFPRHLQECIHYTGAEEAKTQLCRRQLIPSNFQSDGIVEATRAIGGSPTSSLPGHCQFTSDRSVWFPSVLLH